MKFIPILGACTAAALAISAAAAIANGPVPAAGTVKGKVIFDGEAPKVKPLVIKEAQSEGCCAPGEMDTEDRSLRVDKDGGIADVVVALTVDGAEIMMPKEAVVLDQKACRFEPHVLVVPVGASVAYKNSDTVSHNVHTYVTKNEPRNNTVPAGGTLEQKLDQSEAVRVACDIHPWMESHIYVTKSTHYTVSAADGSFSLPEVPAGTYKLEIWHSKLGKGKGEVTVAEDGSSEMVEIKMGAKKKKRRRR